MSFWKPHLNSQKKKEMSSFEPHQQPIAYKVIEKTKEVVELEENKYLKRKLEEKTDILGDVYNFKKGL